MSTIKELRTEQARILEQARSALNEIKNDTDEARAAMAAVRPEYQIASHAASSCHTPSPPRLRP